VGPEVPVVAELLELADAWLPPPEGGVMSGTVRGTLSLAPDAPPHPVMAAASTSVAGRA
jgi:hypothetical protein